MLLVDARDKVIPFAAAPTLGAIDWGALIASGTKAVSTIGPALVDLKTQDKLAKINLELARQGKATIDPSDMPGGIRATAGIDKQTRQMFLILGGGLLLLLAVLILSKRNG